MQHPLNRPASRLLTRVGLAGFKSFARAQSVEFRALTVLAGANSSGKSSLMQALLLLKQTLEVSYDPGALLLDGPNIKFSSADQMFSKFGKAKKSEQLEIEVEFGEGLRLKLTFCRHATKSVDIVAVEFGKQGEIVLKPEMTSAEILAQSSNGEELISFGGSASSNRVEYFVSRRRFLLSLGARRKPDEKSGFEFPHLPHSAIDPATNVLEAFLREFIHLPGLRGNPSRTYPMTAVGNLYSGTFENYTAAIVAHWQEHKTRNKLDSLNEDLVAFE